MSNHSIRGVRVYRFAGFELDVRAAELRHGDEGVRLQEQPFRILTMLLERPGDVVLREEICKRLWPNGTVVEVSHGINAAVLRLREALGDTASNPRFVETVARRGYRFRSPVEVEYRRAPSGRQPAAAGAFDSSELAMGQSIAHFRVEQRLGRGAMGVVYRAEDLNLRRAVALKFLAPEMAGDAVAVGRFQRESRTASALNHPNICTVYSVEECAGQPVIVMELLEGRTLESMLAAGPIAPAEALPLATQMAAALEAAHRKGIVHRDLKPANIMITEFGVKVLDFGLAKQSAAGDSHAGGVTRAGSIVGTPNYMAPELFQGREADTRSDLYSLGSVLLEMLTGNRAAEGSIGKLPAEAAALEPLVRRALQANPEDRWQTAGDFKAALECASATRLGSQAVAPPKVGADLERPHPPALKRRRAKPAWVAGALAATVIAGALAARLGVWPVSLKRAMPARSAAFENAPPLPAALAPHEVPSAPNAMGPAALRYDHPLTRQAAFPITGARLPIVSRLNLSPSGELLAYSNAGKIYVRSLSLDGNDIHLAASPGGEGTPFWSPDGRSLAFAANGKLYTVPAKGGTPTPLGPVNTNLAGAWGPDGSILIGEIRKGLVSISTAGGPTRQVTTPDAQRGETRHLLPQFLPGGKRFLYTAGSDTPGSGMLYAGSFDGAPPVQLLQSDSGAVFVPKAGSKGYLVFDRANYLQAQAFDAATLRVEGAPIRIAGPVSGSRAAAATAISTPDFSATRTTLVYRAAPTTDSLFSMVAMKMPMPRNANEIVVMKNWMAALKPAKN